MKKTISSKQENAALRNGDNFLGPGYKYDVFELKYGVLENKKHTIGLGGKIILESLNIKEDDSLIRLKFHYSHSHIISHIRDSVVIIPK